MWEIVYHYNSSFWRDLFPAYWGTGLFLFGLTGLYYEIKSRRAQPEETREKGGLCFIYVWVSLAFLWTFGVGYDIVSKHRDAAAAMEQNRFETIEGPVQSWSRYEDLRTRVTYDTFSVNGRHFSTRGRYALPLAKGETVRVEYYDHKTIRVWRQEGE